MTINTLTKALGGVQDLLFGIGTKDQTRNETIYAIERIQMIKPLATLAALIALDVTDEDNFYPYAKTLGALTAGDGDSREWWFDVSEAISSDNGYDIIAGNGATVGCWKLASAFTLAGTALGAASGNITAGPYTWAYVRNSTGNYTVTHDLGIEPVVIANAIESDRLISVTVTSTTTFTVVIYNGHSGSGSPEDSDFTFVARFA